MNEELNMMETMNEEFENEETTMDTSSSGGVSIGKVLLGVGGAALAGFALFKNRDKLKEKQDQKRIKKLEKKGYVVIAPDPEEDSADLSKNVDDAK